MSRQPNKGTAIAGQQFVHLPTSADGNRCLLHSMATNLVTRARYGSPAEQAYLNDRKRFGDLFAAIGRQRPDLIPYHDLQANKREVNFHQLAQLTFSQQQEIISAALKDVLVNLLAVDLFAAKSARRNVAVSDHLCEVLIVDFTNWAKKNEAARTEYFDGMDFITRKFQEIDRAGGDKEAALRTWWDAANGGYTEYLKEVGSKDVFLGQEAIGVLCQQFNLNFDYISPSNADHFIRATEDRVSPVTITAYHNGKNHWEAVLPIGLANNLLQKERGTPKNVETTTVSKPIEREVPKTLTPDDTDAQHYGKRYGFENTRLARFKEFFEEGMAHAPDDDPEWSAYYALGAMTVNDSAQATHFANVCSKAKKSGRSEFEAIGLATAQYQFDKQRKAVQTLEERLQHLNPELEKTNKKLKSTLSEADRLQTTQHKKQIETELNDIQGYKDLQGRQQPGTLKRNKDILSGYTERFAVLFSREAQAANGKIADIKFEDICHKIMDAKIDGPGKKGEESAALKIQHAWRKRVANWKKEAPKKMEDVLKAVEPDATTYEVKWKGLHSGDVTFKMGKDAAAEKVMISFTMNQDNSLSLNAEPSKHLETCFEKFAKLTFEQMKKANNGTPVTTITLSDIRPPDKKMECRKAFEAAGFTVHIKGEPNPNKFFKPCGTEADVSLEVVDRSIVPTA
jgi:hypothetical protein